MEKLTNYEELLKEVNDYRITSNKKEKHVYKSHIIIISNLEKDSSIMIYDYQLNGIIDILNNSVNVAKGINIQIYEIGRTVFRNF